jgi:general secretion pathway protein A
MKYFGFSEDPFNLTPDPDFLYLSPSHKEVLSSMLSTIKKRLGTITITGEVGTGKTTLVYTLLKELDKNIRVSFVFNPRVSLEDLLTAILFNLGVPVAETKIYSPLQRFNLYLKERLPLDETVVLIIDEAQNMDMKVLERLNRLSRWDTPASKLLQIILVGQPELEKNLESPELVEFRKRITVRCQLSPLTSAETQSYIDHRLRRAGSSISKVFTPQAVELLCKYSRGIPRMINQLCDHSFLMGYARSIPKIDAKTVKDVIQSNPHWHSRKRIRFPQIKPLNFLASIFGLAALFLGLFYLMSPDGNLKLLPREKRVYKVNISQSQVSAKTTPAEDSSPKEEPAQFVKMQPGWSLSILTRRYYQSVHLTFKDLILEANPQITDANVIQVDDVIKIPAVTEDSLLIPSSDQTYQIHLGTFNSPEFLKDFETQPSLKGKKLQIVPRKASSEEIWYRFVAGNFSDRKEALEVIRILKEKGLLPAFTG